MCAAGNKKTNQVFLLPVERGGSRTALSPDVWSAPWRAVTTVQMEKTFPQASLGWRKAFSVVSCLSFTNRANSVEAHASSLCLHINLFSSSHMVQCVASPVSHRGSKLSSLSYLLLL